MLNRAGQAARRAGRILHRPLRLAGVILLILLIGFDILSWRLQQRPIALPGLAARIAAAASGLQPGLDIHVGSASLAWEGFHSGGAPLDLRLGAIRLSTQQDAISGAIADMRVTLSLAALLHGRIAPVALIADHAHLAIRPRPDRSAIKTLQAAAAQLAALLGKPPAAEPGRPGAGARTGSLTLDRLRLVSIDHAGLSLDDPAAALHLAGPDAHILLRRQADGAVTAEGKVRLHGGTPQDAGIPVALDYHAAAGRGVARALIGPGPPAALFPGIRQLAALRLPLTLRAALPFGQDGKPQGVALDIALGQGEIAIADGTVPVSGGRLRLILTPATARLTSGTIRLGGSAPAPVITLSGTATQGSTMQAALTVAADHVTAGALPTYWPPGLAPKVRLFVLRRVSGGIARDGLFHFALSRDPATHRITLDHLDGGFQAAGVTFAWIKGLPEMTGLTGTVRFPNKTRLVINADRGRVGGLAIGKGLVVISGLTGKDQDAAISGTLAGPLQDAVSALLAAPLLRRQPALPAEAGLAGKAHGHVQARLALDIPLIKDLTLRDINLDANGRLTRLYLPLPLGQLALDDGAMRVQASFRGTEISGTGMIAGNPARFTGHVSRLGARRYALHLSTSLDQKMLAAAGYAGKAWSGDPVPAQLTINGAPGQGEARLAADLTGRRLALPALGWSKPPGVPGEAWVGLSLGEGKPTFRSLALTAPGLIVAAHRAGQVISVDALDIGRSRATGRITAPSSPGAPWLVALAGPVLDLSGAVAEAANSAPAAPAFPTRAAALPWRLRAAFDRLILHEQGPGPVTALNLRATGSGLDLAALRATALLAQSHYLELGIGRVARTSDHKRPIRAREIHLAAGDAGALLQALGMPGVIDHGRLRLDATETTGRLQGRLAISDFRLRHAPLIGKVLQGLTLYGLAEATSGPGLGFSELVAPFTLTDRVLMVHNGRAFSPSLGLTMTGEVDLARRDYDLGGTIVPAYALNSLPGRIPLLGRLFRTRKGSGLFSARYTVEGPFNAPHIVVNPLSVLAPGALAGIFGSGPPRSLPLTSTNAPKD